ncbi:hypothetical protein FPOAC2_14042 [Fusarium poae]
MARTKRLLSSGNVPFAILFQVQALVWNNYINPSGGSALLDLLERVALDAKEKKVAMPITTDAMKVLFQRIPYPCPGADPRELDVVSIMADAMNTEYEYRADDPQRDRIYGSKIPDHQVWVFKASVTPTRVILTGPDAESRNRVLRMFPDNNDSFLRVTFCDENGQDLHFNPQVDNDPIFSQYRRVMDEGIEIAGRKYLFLGFSHSSLRSHSAWFSAPFPNQDFQQQTCDVILGALGDFQDIRVPAKCAARIGQAFSVDDVTRSEHMKNLRYQLQFQGTHISDEMTDEPKIRQFLNAMFGGRGPQDEVGFDPSRGIIFHNLPRLNRSRLLSDVELEYYVSSYFQNGKSNLEGPLRWYLSHTSTELPRRVTTLTEARQILNASAVSDSHPWRDFIGEDD